MCGQVVITQKIFIKGIIMRKKLICLTTLVVVLSMVFAGIATAADPSLVAWYRFDGDATDSSGNNFHGTEAGDPTYEAGVFGQAISLDGDGDYVDCGDPPEFDITDQISFTYWIKVVALDKEWNTVLSRGDDSWRSSRAGLNNFMESGMRGTSGDYLFGVTPVDDGQWHHIAASYDGTTFYVYADGELDASEPSTGQIVVSSFPLYIGDNSGATGRYWNGLIDDVMIFNRALSHEEIQTIMLSSGGTYPLASSPSPADGAMHEATWVSLGWSAGDFAVSHDVYMGDNFDDVNNGTGDTFRGNQALNSVYFVAGFTGYAFPDGLENGKTYYWRIDEVNDANAASPWKGPVWSFWIPSKKAYEPVPGDRSHFVDSENLNLSWTPGFGSVLHTVYFGDDYDTVANATNGPQQGLANFSPGPLETEKTYFWRVDEFEPPGTHTGDVWSFTTAKVGGGIRGDYYRGMNFETFVLTRTDPEINFNWGDPGGPDATVGDNTFSCRWTGEVEAGFTETYTFYAAADDGVRLWVDGVQLVNAWVDQGTTEYRGTIDLIAGNTYNIVMEQYENGGGAAAYLRWSSPSTPKQIIPQAALSPPIKASSPSPSNGATGTKMTPILRWGAGDFAASHEVYFGTDANSVKNATTASPEYKGPKALGDEIYDPGKLAWFTTYYWRVDEVNNLNPESPWVGNLWSFTTGDFLVIDDFEDYDAGDNQIWYSWHDGLGYGSPGTDPYFAGNGTGAAVGDETTASYTEESIRNSGSKSMPLSYDNNKQGYAKYSETELTLTAPRDWTEEGVANLSLWFRGYPGSTGSFVEGPVGTFTMTGSGADIQNNADEFHFAYKTLTGAGSIVAKVVSVQNTNVWAKAGVMIRESLEPGSVNAIMVVTPGQGVSSQRRDFTDDVTSYTQTAGIVVPYWVKIERDLAGNFTSSSSANGSTWQIEGAPVNITMGANVYIGLALTSHNVAQTCQAVFTNVTTTGSVSPQWANQDIGITSNAPEPLYVAVSNSAGTPAVVVHNDSAAATIDTWTEWIIPLQAFADQGIVLTNIDRIAIGLGTQGNMAIPGGSGKMFFDDIRLYRPREAAVE